MFQESYKKLGPGRGKHLDKCYGTGGSPVSRLTVSTHIHTDLTL